MKNYTIVIDSGDVFFWASNVIHGVYIALTLMPTVKFTYWLNGIRSIYIQTDCVDVIKIIQKSFSLYNIKIVEVS